MKAIGLVVVAVLALGATSAVAKSDANDKKAELARKKQEAEKRAVERQQRRAEEAKQEEAKKAEEARKQAEQAKKCSPTCTSTCDCSGNPIKAPKCSPTCTATCDCSGNAIKCSPTCTSTCDCSGNPIAAAKCSPTCTSTCDCSGNPIKAPKCSPTCTATCDCSGNAIKCSPTCTKTCDCSGNPIVQPKCTPTCTDTCDCSGNPIEPKPKEAKNDKNDPKKALVDPVKQAAADEKDAPLPSADIAALRQARGDRRKETVARLRRRWGGLLAQEKGAAELKNHSRRVALLQRVRIVADQKKDAKTVEAVDELITEEDRRHANAMNALREGALP